MLVMSLTWMWHTTLWDITNHFQFNHSEIKDVDNIKSHNRNEIILIVDCESFEQATEMNAN